MEKAKGRGKSKTAPVVKMSEITKIRGEDNATTVVPIYDFYPRVVELLGDATGGGDTSDGSDTNDVDTNVDAYFGATLNLRTANGSSWWESC